MIQKVPWNRKEEKKCQREYTIFESEACEGETQ
jgi:hypothetical protein